MKLPYPARLTQARSSPGAITEDDAELHLPPVIAGIAIVGTPIDETATPPSADILNQSFAGGNQVRATGAVAASSANCQRFSKGMWHIRGRYIFQFTGTTNNANDAFLQLTNKAGVVVVSTWVEVAIVTGTNLVTEIDVWLSLPEDGCRFVLSIPATIAGDVIKTSFRFLANKIW